MHRFGLGLKPHGVCATEIPPSHALCDDVAGLQGVFEIGRVCRIRDVLGDRILNCAMVLGR